MLRVADAQLRISTTSNALTHATVDIRSRRELGFGTKISDNLASLYPMTPSVYIDIADGSVKLLGTQHTISRRANQSTIEAMLVEFPTEAKDHGNGCSWLYVGGLTLGEMPCVLSLLFHKRKLAEIHFNVNLPNVTVEHGWPTQESIDNEIEFVRKIFGNQLKRRFRDKEQRFNWGVVWSAFDSRGFRATAGIRYA